MKQALKHLAFILSGIFIVLLIETLCLTIHFLCMLHLAGSPIVQGGAWLSLLSIAGYEYFLSALSFDWPFILVFVALAELRFWRTKLPYLAFYTIGAAASLPVTAPQGYAGYRMLFGLGYMIAGLLAGYAYWLIAGRHAGELKKYGITQTA